MGLCDSVYMIKTFGNWSVVAAEGARLLHLVSASRGPPEHRVKPMTARCVPDCETTNAPLLGSHGSLTMNNNVYDNDNVQQGKRLLRKM